MLVLSALAVVDTDDVESGWGWELITGVGVATWVAHLYAEAVGDHLRHTADLPRSEIRRAMVDGAPILVAAVAPAAVLLLGRVEVIAVGWALWVAVAVAFLQLVGVGAFVGATSSARRSRAWQYAAVTAAFGVLVVSLKLVLGH